MFASDLRAHSTTDGKIIAFTRESTLVINHRNHRGEVVNEVLTFDDGLVREGHGTYLEGESRVQG